MMHQDKLLAQFSGRLCDRIANQTIKLLQSYKDGLLGESGLKNVWEEICVQVQGEQGLLWDAYEQTVEKMVKGFCDELKGHEVSAIWLQTDSGQSWLSEEEVKEADGGALSDEIPYDPDEVVYYITHVIYGKAADWSNKNIQAYNDGDSITRSVLDKEMEEDIKKYSL